MKAKIISELKSWAKALLTVFLVAAASIPVGFGIGWGFIFAVKAFIDLGTP